MKKKELSKIFEEEKIVLHPDEEEFIRNFNPEDQRQRFLEIRFEVYLKSRGISKAMTDSYQRASLFNAFQAGFDSRLWVKDDGK